LFDAALANPDGRAARLVGRATVAFAIMCLLLAVAAAVMLGMSQTRLLARPMHIPVADAEQLGPAMVPLAVSFAVFGVFGVVARCRRSVSLCLLCFALFLPVGANAGMGVIDVIFGVKSGRQVARKLSTMPAGTELACMECFPNGVAFYLGRTATLISYEGGELTSKYIEYRLKQSPQWPKQIVPMADFDVWLASQKNPVYLIVRGGNLSRLETVAAARGATVQILDPEYFGAQLPAPGGP
jgi:hypothetical protein